jgi:hypothetical protein
MQCVDLSDGLIFTNLNVGLRYGDQTRESQRYMGAQGEEYQPSISFSDIIDV